MIVSFQNSETESFYHGRSTRVPWQVCAKAALRKLDAINYARALNDLRTPPGNRLEQLSGRRTGQHSIRVDDQWRICFRWEADGAHDVEIVDYH
jgi:toxin HigB-1